MTETLAGSPIPLEQAFDAALLDLDGVTYRGPKAIPSAASAIRRARNAGMAIAYITNNASRRPEEVARHLTKLGIEASPDEVVTAAQVGAAVLAQRLEPGDRVLVVGGPALRAEVEARGLTIVETAEDRPMAVIQGFHPDVGWRNLAEASYAIRNGARFFATNRDSTLPNEKGIAPGNGSLVQTVVTATGVEPESSGKPDPRMFLEAAARVGARAPLVVGDRLDTDIAGARAAGMPSLLVLTGVSTISDVIGARPEERPDFLGHSLDALADNHPEPHLENGVVTVGEAIARVIDDRVTLDGGEEMDRIRAACVAAWSTVDEGGEAHIEGLPESGIQ